MTLEHMFLNSIFISLVKLKLTLVLEANAGY